jgi:hypothetical protein
MSPREVETQTSYAEPTDRCLEHQPPLTHRNGDSAYAYLVSGKRRLALRLSVNDVQLPHETFARSVGAEAH